MHPSEQAEVWILHRERTLLVQIAGLGVPEAAVVSSDGTLGGTYYDPMCLLGPWPVPSHGGWGEAGEVARTKAAELGYQVDYYDPRYDYQEYAETDHENYD